MNPSVINKKHGDNWAVYNADCVSFVENMPDNSVDFSIYSPPFANLYTYSDSVADMGNCADDDEFFQQYAFLLQQLHRVTKPGRLTAVHCCDMPMQKWKDGVIGMRDFSGGIVAAHIAAGWTWHSPRITIWKDPVVEMQRTKAVGLLHKQLKKDSTRSRVGNPDYMLIFRKQGENENPVGQTPEGFPVEKWQQWASPVWMDIDQTNTLNTRAARDPADERHICPLQLDVIERCLVLWSNPGDVVFSPFTGIGSEGVMSIRLGRKFVGTELKPSYWRQACGYIEQVARETPTLFNA